MARNHVVLCVMCTMMCSTLAADDVPVGSNTEQPLRVSPHEPAIAAEPQVPPQIPPPPAPQLPIPPASQESWGPDQPVNWDGYPDGFDSRYLMLSTGSQLSHPVGDPCYRCACCGPQPHSRFCRCWHAHWKPHLQESHWGYCNYFSHHPLGASTTAAFSRQAYRGSVDQLSLYEYDFYPADSAYRYKLTARGEVQLSKLIDRFVLTPGAIKVAITGNPTLDEGRRREVVRMIHSKGIEIDPAQVALFLPKYRTSATEAAASQSAFEQMLQRRGRTIEGGESATFSGRAIFGQ